jgi:hypothetical protein
MGNESTLSSLVEASSGSAVPVDELLRRLKVISVRAGLPSLDEWVQHELNGYPEGVDLPPYRGPFDVAVLGHLSGAFGREVKNAPLPPLAFPESLRDGFLWRIALPQGVAQLENWAARGNAIEFGWPPDMIVYTEYLQRQGECTIDPSFTLIQARQVLDHGTVVGVLRAVRDRVLTLALRLEADNPALGEPGGPQVGPGVGRDVSIIMHGGTATFAVASQHLSQVATTNTPSPAIEAILQQVRDAGVDEQDIEELRDALTDDSNAGDLSSPGPQTMAWLRRWSGKAGGVVATTTLGAVTKILLEQGLPL